MFFKGGIGVQGKNTRVDKKKQKQEDRRKKAQARGQKPIR